jgi:hypothetical protein
MHLAIGVLVFQLVVVSHPALQLERNWSAQYQGTASSDTPSIGDLKLVNWQPVEASTYEASNPKTNAANTTLSAEVAAARSLAGAFVAPPESTPAFKAGRMDMHRSNRRWAALVLAQHTAATFDAWSTRRALSGGGRFEADPLMRPFANSPAIYGVIHVGPAMLDYIGRRMNHSQNKWLHRLWWVPQTAATAGFLFSGSRNLANSR